MVGGPIIEAEDYENQTLFAPFEIQAAGGTTYIMVPGEGNVIAATDGGAGQAHYALKATATQITVYATVNLRTATTDSFWHQITGLSPWTQQNAALTNGFQEITLGTVNGAVVGQTYTLKVQRREAGSQFDKFRLVGASFIEGKAGDDVIVTPPPVPNYVGTPYNNITQTIPGRLQMEFYDVGGEGVAFHDSDNDNSGSGGLNTGPEAINHFRENESVDISYAKFYNAADNSEFNFDDPEENSLYVGWTETGEWTRYTVNVTQTGTYSLDIMNSAYQNGILGIQVDGVSVGQISILSNFNAADTIPWRQWHHWRFSADTVRIPLTAGKHVLTFTTVATAFANYDYIDFKLVAATPATPPAVPTANLVAGQMSYDILCMACHGATGEKGGINNRAIVNDATRNTLAKIINDTMPNYDPSQCRGECAENIAAYALNGFKTTP